MKKAKASLLLALIMTMGPGALASQILDIPLPDRAKSTNEKVAYYQEYLDSVYSSEEIELFIENFGSGDTFSQPEEEQINILEK